jgi:acylpyruvate hydrolase
MRLATVRTADGRTHAAREDGSGLTLLPWTDLSALLGEPGWAELACCDGRAVSREEVTYHTLVPQPNKIICLGLNYATHIAEMGRPTPEHPTPFAKFSGALIGASDPITLPYVSDQVDWEAELGVVIGSPPGTCRPPPP